MFTVLIFVLFLGFSGITNAETIPFSLFDEQSRSGNLVSKEATAKQWLKSATYRWMSHLPDSLPLNQVSIPGTHDTAASSGGLFCETQTWPLAEQLRAGIRYIDIRARRAGTVFAIHHGVCFLNLFFEQVMNDVKSFLQQNPTEFLLMRVKEEHTPLSGSQSFSQIWSTYMKTFEDLFVPDLSESRRLPNVGMLRGKVLVLRQASFGGVGMEYSSELTSIQDAYQVFFSVRNNPFGPETVSITQKKDLVRQQVRETTSSNKLVLNHASGATGMFPEAVARITHKTVYREIGPYNGPKLVGVVIMDYPGEWLVYQIVKSNMISLASCNNQTWRGESDRTYVEFRLPRVAGGTGITFRKGSYGTFVFPRCHRVTWTDMRFSCESPSGEWKLKGVVDADGFCFNSNTNQAYLIVGAY